MDIMRHILGRRFTFKGPKVRGRETQRFSGKIHSAKSGDFARNLKGKSLFSRIRHGITLPLTGKVLSPYFF